MGNRVLGALLALAVATASTAGVRPLGQRTVDPSLERDSPRPLLVALDCPADRVVECDGAGNEAERQAWLDAFAASADAGCEPAALEVRTTPGEVLRSWSFPDFADLSDWTLNGTTGVIPNPAIDAGGRAVLRLTNSFSQSGSAFLSEPVSLADDASFSAFFSFRITGSAGVGDADGPGADGSAFVLQTVSNRAGGVGGGIGYQGIAPSLAVELDTYDNGAWDSFDGNHVGIDLDGDVASIEQASLPPRLNDGNTWHCWVDYGGATGRLEVRVTRDVERPAAPTVTAIVDLRSVLGGTEAFAGFTSGTGAGTGVHDVLSFFLHDTVDPFGCADGTGSETAVANAIDACADADACTRLFRVVDTTPPELTVGELPDCFASAAEAEAAVLAATTAWDACSGSVAATVSSQPGCDGLVVVSAEDDCGNRASLDVPVLLDADPPAVTPLVVGLSCGGELVVEAESFLGASVRPEVSVADACDGAPLVSNDRTGMGPSAEDLYPCGRTPVVFEASDACGRTSSCVLVVVVEPPAFADVGPVLRVAKDASGAPVLDWTGAGPAGPAATWAVLSSAATAGEVAPVLDLRLAANPTWTEPASSARGGLVLYDVRRAGCDGSLSAD